MDVKKNLRDGGLYGKYGGATHQGLKPGKACLKVADWQEGYNKVEWEGDDVPIICDYIGLGCAVDENIIIKKFIIDLIISVNLGKLQ